MRTIAAFESRARLRLFAAVSKVRRLRFLLFELSTSTSAMLNVVKETIVSVCQCFQVDGPRQSFEMETSQERRLARRFLELACKNEPPARNFLTVARRGRSHAPIQTLY
jgi:hypothetical protein